MPKDDRRDLLSRLLDCHARIREMLALARKLGEGPEPSPEDIVEIASDVRRYFRRALPMHTRDEEESIAPRLADTSEEAKRSLARMQHEHLEHDSLVAKLMEDCELLREEPARWSEHRLRLLGHLDALEPQLVAHLDEEERAIFPLCATVLDDAARDIIVREMEERRAREGGGGGGRRRRMM